MSRVENIEHEIEQLSPDELAAFREWFARFDGEAWDDEIERDARGGKLDALAQQALAAHAAGKTKKL